MGERSRPLNGEEARVVELAEQAIDLTMRDPARALGLAREACERAGPVGGPVSARCQLAAGEALLALGQVEEAGRCLQLGLAMCDGRAGDVQLKGRLTLPLASVTLLQGDPDSALALINGLEGQSLDLDADADMDPEVFLALVQSRRASLLIETEHHGEAIALFDQAVPVLEANGTARDAVKARSNRGLAHLHLHDLAQAEIDIKEAEAQATRHEYWLMAASAAENLGYLAYVRGDYPSAAEALSRAERRFHTRGIIRGQVWIDRAKILLAVQNPEAAVVSARRAGESLKAAHEWMLYPTADLLLAEAALASGDPQTALAAATSAARDFRTLGRLRSHALARHLQLRARRASGLPVDPTDARDVARELHATAALVEAVDARILAAEVETENDNLDRAAAHLRFAARLGEDGPAVLKANSFLAEALLRIQQGRPRQAYLPLSAGLQVLEQQRLPIGSSSIRARVSTQRSALARLGLRLAVESGDALAVHVWGEHRRTAAGLLRAVRPSQDQALQRLLEEHRAVTAELQAADAKAVSIQKRLAIQARLEAQIREREVYLRGDGSASHVTPTVHDLSAELGELALVEVVTLDGWVHGLTLATGRLQHHQLGRLADIHGDLLAGPFALAGLARRVSDDGRAAAREMARRAGQRVSSFLFEPLLDAIGDRDVVLIPPPSLDAFPWALAPALRGRAVSVCPSTTLWHKARHQNLAETSRVVGIAGPGLAGAETESAGVAALYGNARLLGPEESSAAATAREIDGALIAHFAAHADLRHDDPGLSALRLADGPFTVYDVEDLARSPFHVVLAACAAARNGVVSGREIHGLATALLSLDTASILAPTVPIPDASTRIVMLEYHRALSRGVTPAQALAQAQSEAFASDDAAAAAAASFVCLGAGHRPPVVTPGPAT